MKKKTILLVALIFSVLVLIMNIIVCIIYSLYTQENNAYVLGIIVLPLLPFTLLLAIPNYSFKLRTNKENKKMDDE